MKHRLTCQECEASETTARLIEDHLPDGWTDASPYGISVDRIKEHRATCPYHNGDYDHTAGDVPASEKESQQSASVEHIDAGSLTYTGQTHHTNHNL